MQNLIIYEFLQHPTPPRLEDIKRLYQAAGWWQNPQEDIGLIRAIIAGSHCFLTASYRERIIAMGRAISDRISDAYIQDLTVDSRFRKLGIGANLVRKLVQRLRHDGIKWIGLIAEDQSGAFYEKSGFSPMPNAIPMLKR